MKKIRDPNRPTTDQVIPLARAFMALPGNEDGGTLHVVLSDGNVKDYHLEHEPERCREEGDTKAAELADLLKRMTETQRRKVVEAIWRQNPLERR